MISKAENIINDRRRYDYFPGKIIMVLFSVYVFLSFYEIYINKLFGAYTKYYIFIFMIVLLAGYKYIKIRYYHVCILIWLIYKLISTAWSWNGYNKIVSAHILSQLGMVALLCVLTVVNFDETFMRKLLNMVNIISFSMAVLTLFFAKAYVGGSGFVAESRQVLTILGAQNDPNDMAVFFLMGITISLYFMLYERHQIIFNLIIFSLNTFSILQTGSRGGFLSLIAICFLFAVAPLGKNEKKSNKLFRLLVLCLALILVYLIVFRFVFPDALERLLNTESYEGGSGRTSIWNNALELFAANPIFGSGWGCYYGYNGVFNAAHNTYVQSLCDTGILGTLLFLTPIFFVFVNSFKNHFYLPILFICSGLLPAIFLDSMDKRFFWNAIIISAMLINSNMRVTPVNRKDTSKKESNAKVTNKCKYIKTRVRMN